MNFFQSTQETLVGTPGNEDEVSLLEVWSVLWKHRLLIVSVTLISTFSALAVSFVLPKSYVSNATILPVSGNDAGSMMAASLASQLGPMASMLGGVGAGRTADLVEILSSRSMAERVIARCQLETKLKGWTYRGQLLEKVMKMTTITGPSMKNKVIDIQVETPAADLAANVANAYVAELKVMLDEIGYNSAARNRKFIEHQLGKVKQELAISEEKMAQFQATNEIASLPDTVVASIKSLSDMEAQRLSSEVELKATEEALGVMRSKVSQLQADPSYVLELELKRNSLSAQQAALQKAKETFLSKLTKLPPKGMALARLQRDVQVQNAIYLALSQQYETAMISEQRESESFLPLDKAEIPDRHSKPKKLIIVLSGLLAGLFLGIVGAFVYSYKEEKIR